MIIIFFVFIFLSIVRRIAIIGAGAAGSSAAFFLHKQLLTLAHRDKIEITIYEKEPRVGGRAAIIHPYNDSKYDPVEIGASIYASVNLHLIRAIE
jgi:prenylcysteine oxidase/farnesylcysteine lyase